MVASHRGRLECMKALLRAGADPNFMNGAGDLTLFWAMDGGVDATKLLIDYGVDLESRNPKDWTPLSYAKAKGKYGATEEHGIYPEVSRCSPKQCSASALVTSVWGIHKYLSSYLCLYCISIGNQLLQIAT